MARQAAQRDDRTAELGEAERTAALQERHELFQVAALHAGVTARSAGDVFADAGRMGDEDAAYSDAQRTVERIDRRRAQRQRDMADQAQRMTEVTGLASRSAATVTGNPDLLAEAKRLHREFATASRVARNRVMARPPFAGPGSAVRSEPVTCSNCQAAGATPEESFAIHHPELLPPFEVAEEQAGDSERRWRGYAREISR